MRIIINADDLGGSASVNDAVFRLMGDGRITSATLLANGPAIEDAGARLKEFPQCSFGVHLNLSEFKPLSGDPRLRPLCGDDEEMIENRIREVPLGADLKAGILSELSAQIKHLRDLGVPLSHIDSHQHVHTIPGLLGVVKQIQKRFGLRRIRISRNFFAAGCWPKSTRQMQKRVYNFCLRRWGGSRTVSGFTNFASFLPSAAEAHRRHPTMELMCHPGHASPSYTEESRLLATDWRADLPFECQLISYHEL